MYLLPLCTYAEGGQPLVWGLERSIARICACGCSRLFRLEKAYRLLQLRARLAAERVELCAGGHGHFAVALHAPVFPKVPTCLFKYSNVVFC